MPYSGETLAVAVSGGADSLYSLFALLESGADVFALHGLFLSEAQRGPDYALMLKRLETVCAALGARLETADLSERFSSLVIDAFAASYLGGRTPNPCAGCNRDIKFGLLLDEARRLGARGIATGHYARLAAAQDAPALLNGTDGGKDQSYFLALTPLERLRHAVFPVGGLRKAALVAGLERKLAAMGLELPQKGESHEICFIPNDDYRAFLDSYASKRGLVPPGPGPILLADGSVLKIGGKAAGHRGLWRYTQGQRHGLGLAWSEPLYVMGKDIVGNALVVGVKGDFRPDGCVCGQVNFLVPPDHWPELVLAKTRYRQRLRPARAEVFEEGGEVRIRLEFVDCEGAPPSAPGQVAALYAPYSAGVGDLRLLAGGIIGALP